jgi:hypothetical protein
MNSMSANGNPLKRIEYVALPNTRKRSACFAWQAAIHPQHLNSFQFQFDAAILAVTISPKRH